MADASFNRYVGHIRWVYLLNGTYVRMPVIGQFVHAERLKPGMHGTNPAGGEDIDVFIERRSFGFRLTIVTDGFAVVIDVP